MRAEAGFSRHSVSDFFNKICAKRTFSKAPFIRFWSRLSANVGWVRILMD
jgi:hypothetical protein